MMDKDKFYGIGELVGSHDFGAADRLHVAAFDTAEERELWVGGYLEWPRLMTRGESRRACDVDEAGEVLADIYEYEDGERSDPDELVDFLSTAVYEDLDLRQAREDRRDDADLSGAITTDANGLS